MLCACGPSREEMERNAKEESLKNNLNKLEVSGNDTYRGISLIVVGEHSYVYCEANNGGVAITHHFGCKCMGSKSDF